MIHAMAPPLKSLVLEATGSGSTFVHGRLQRSNPLFGAASSRREIDRIWSDLRLPDPMR